MTPSTTPSTALITAGDSQSGADMRQNVITGATGAMCAVLGAGKWCCGSGRAGERFPQLPPAYVALPDHRQPPSGSWRWARQLGNLPLLRWWPPASVALPKRVKRFSELSYFTTFHLFPHRDYIYFLNVQVDDKDDLSIKINTFSTTKRALSASCWATCFISTASVNSLPKVKCVWKNTIQLFLKVKNPTENITWSLLPTASYQWNVIQDEAEGGGSFCKVLTDLPRHKLSLSDELTGIKPSLRKNTQWIRVSLRVGDLAKRLISPSISLQIFFSMLKWSDLVTVAGVYSEYF